MNRKAPSIAAAVLALLAAACSGSSSATAGSPGGGGPAALPSAVAYSHCMRTHGVPSFPDPTNSQGRVVFNASAHGISDSMSHAPRFVAKLNTCQRQAGNFPFSFG